LVINKSAFTACPKNVTAAAAAAAAATAVVIIHFLI
jgi:hypothetical protein